MKYRTLISVFILSISLTCAAQTIKKTTYPIVVSFESICCGVPSDSSIRLFVKSFKKQYKIKKMTAYHIGPMGREGEYYLAFKLTELNRKQKVSFISKIKKVKKAADDSGQLSFEEALEVDPAAIPQRATTEKIIL